MKLIIEKLLVVRPEEQLEDVVRPAHAVVLFDIGVQVTVLHVGREIEIIIVPKKPGFGGGLGFAVLPIDGEILQQLGLLPGGFLVGAVDGDRPGRPTALGGMDDGNTFSLRYFLCLRPVTKGRDHIAIHRIAPLLKIAADFFFERQRF